MHASTAAAAAAAATTRTAAVAVVTATAAVFRCHYHCFSLVSSATTPSCLTISAESQFINTTTTTTTAAITVVVITINTVINVLW
jgi:hypothetical protein